MSAPETTTAAEAPASAVDNKELSKEARKAARLAEENARAQEKAAQLIRFKELFGANPLVQSTTYNSKVYTPVANLSNAEVEGLEVLLRARVSTTRSKGKMAFLVLRDGSDSVQAVCAVDDNIPKAMIDFMGQLPLESIVDVVAHALGEYTLTTSPLPDVAALLQAQVCSSDIPHWVSITSIYEQLTREQKAEVKRKFRSFAGFLRAHGRSLAVSTDMLQVSMWICKNPPSLPAPDDAAEKAGPSLPSSTPPPADDAAATTAIQTRVASTVVATAPVAAVSTKEEVPAPPRPVAYSPMQVLNALYDVFPPHRTLSLRDALELLPPEMATSPLPRKFSSWLATYPQYFVIDGAAEEEDTRRVMLRRASDRQPLDYAAAIYAHLPTDTAREMDAVLAELHPSMRTAVQQLGVEHLAALLPKWLEVTSQAPTPLEGSSPPRLMVRRLQAMDNLQDTITNEVWKRERSAKRQSDSASPSDV